AEAQLQAQSSILGCDRRRRSCEQHGGDDCCERLTHFQSTAYMSNLRFSILPKLSAGALADQLRKAWRPLSRRGRPGTLARTALARRAGVAGGRSSPLGANRLVADEGVPLHFPERRPA